ncbi:hypothetical protein [Chryseobacterium sp.]|uniref:hypothetical protein n=1 Tax=Chryseobacterium sp. TaxID=1871047 RepID=UPI0038905403
MQKYIYLPMLAFLFTSCYTYQRKPQVATAPENSQNNIKKSADGTVQAVNTQVIVPINIQNELQPSKNYKINSNGKSYKVIVDRWEGDSLVAHSVKKPSEIIKFHKNNIQAEDITERRFNKPISDIITILTYTGIGVGVWMLLK